MRQIIALTWGVLALIFLLSLFLVAPLTTPDTKTEDTPIQSDTPLTTSDLPFTSSTQVLTLPQGTVDNQYTVTVLQEDGTIESLSLGDYLFGVVAAEMPASFHTEALKAQVVAARTYTMSKLATTTTAHPDADLCTCTSCCQSYISPADAMENWGVDGTLYSEKIADAIQATDGQVLYYEGELIEALYHASSPGQTVDAVEVWGNDIPYLVGVDSPEGEDVPNWESTLTLTTEEFSQIILTAYPQADLSGNPSGWCAILTTNSAGGVDSLSIGGIPIQGTTLRTLLGLRSTFFTISTTDTTLTFSVTGYGHGVGMSQYGAEELANNGSTYQEILLWYYTDVTLGTLDNGG